MRSRGALTGHVVKDPRLLLAPCGVTWYHVTRPCDARHNKLLQYLFCYRGVIRKVAVDNKKLNSLRLGKLLQSPVRVIRGTGLYDFGEGRLYEGKVYLTAGRDERERDPASQSRKDL